MTGFQNDKGTGQVDKVKLGPRVMWAQGYELDYTVGLPGGCGILGTGPQVRESSLPRAAGSLYPRGKMRQGQFLQQILSLCISRE